MAPTRAPMPTDLLPSPERLMDSDRAAAETPSTVPPALPASVPPAKPRLRPLIGMPGLQPAANWRSATASAVLHLLIILLIVTPWFAPELIDRIVEGAGGSGPVGGGGGGRMGSGGILTPDRPEGLRYIRPPMAQPPPTLPVLPPPPEIKKPEEKKPEPVVQPTLAPPAPAVVQAPSEVPGSGGGTGADGTNGSGPGTGGGVGSGVGTGRGSGSGPGTGGGLADKYPPTVTNLPILPLPVPGRVRPYRMVAYFDVDEKGNSQLIGFNPSNDGGYNRRLKDMLNEIRFRPAVLKNGTPVRDTAVIRAEAP